MNGFLAAASEVLTSPLSTPLTVSVSLLITLIFSCYIGNITTGYWSFVDRAWSTFPVGLVSIFALWPWLLGGAYNGRVTLMASLVTLWGVRLTYNFARKGGFKDEEDYRWAVLRKWFADHDKFHPLGQELFNFFFVAFYQLVLIFLFTVPPLYVAHVNATPLNEKDALLQVLFILFLAGETWADETQWAFHQSKKGLSHKERAAKGGDIARGFCTSGPFRYSRHLNFFCEQALWWTYAAFALNATMSSTTGCKMILCFSKLWPATGAFLLTLLFQGSTTMTENLTLAKYPEYEHYQRTTSRLIPWFPGNDVSSKRD